MDKLKENWRRQPWYEKILHIIGLFTAFGVMILALLQLLGVWENAAYVHIPCTALLMLIQAFDNRRRSRGLMVFSLCTGVFLVICWIAVVCIR